MTVNSVEGPPSRKLRLTTALGSVASILGLVVSVSLLAIPESEPRLENDREAVESREALIAEGRRVAELRLEVRAAERNNHPVC